MQSIFVTEYLLRYLHSLLFQNKESFDKDQANLRFLLVDILTSYRKNAIPCKEWLILRVSNDDREKVISSILDNCEAILEGKDISRIEVEETEDVPEPPETLAEALETDQLNTNRRKNSDTTLLF